MLLLCWFDHFLDSRADIFCWIFGKSMTPKRHSEINWPLMTQIDKSTYVLHNSYYYGIEILFIIINSKFQLWPNLKPKPLVLSQAWEYVGCWTCGCYQFSNQGIEFFRVCVNLPFLLDPAQCHLLKIQLSLLLGHQV